MHVATCHRDAERTERVLHADRVAMRGEHIRQALVHLRRLIGTAADEDDALLAQSRLDRRPVDDARLDCSSAQTFRIFAVGWSGQSARVALRGHRNSQSRTEQAYTVRRRTRPAACERLITRPAPCTVE